MAIHIDGLRGIAEHIQIDVIRAADVPSPEKRAAVYRDAANVAQHIAAALRPRSETLAVCWTVASEAWAAKARGEGR